jgi:hypothetical protein
MFSGVNSPHNDRDLGREDGTYSATHHVTASPPTLAIATPSVQRTSGTLWGHRAGRCRLRGDHRRAKCAIHFMSGGRLELPRAFTQRILSCHPRRPTGSARAGVAAVISPATVGEKGENRWCDSPAVAVAVAVEPRKTSKSVETYRNLVACQVVIVAGKPLPLMGVRRPPRTPF